jgi:hypothetical protein
MYVFPQTNFIEQVDCGMLVITQSFKKFLPFMQWEGSLVCSQDLIAEPYPEHINPLKTKRIRFI